MIAIQVKVAAAQRQLNKISAESGADIVERSTKKIVNICDTAWEEVSILHVDVLEEDDPDEELESRASRLEDTIFEVKDLCEKMIWRAKNCSPSTSLITIPVDQVKVTSSFVEPDDKGAVEEKVCAHELEEQKVSQMPISTGSDRSPVVPVSLPLKKMTQAQTKEGFRLATSGGAQESIVTVLSSSSSVFNPCAPAFQPSDRHMGVGSSLEFCSTYQHRTEAHGAALLPPGLKLELEKFDGDVMKFWEFKRRFKRHVEQVYQCSEDRIAFLESMCIGRAHDPVAGLSCLEDSDEAYLRAWQRLNKRFRDTSKLMSRLKEAMVIGPVIKEGDAKALMVLGDKMYRCEVSFQSWNKEWMLNS